MSLIPALLLIAAALTPPVVFPALRLGEERSKSRGIKRFSEGVESPLEEVKLSCGPQDKELKTVDLSRVAAPEWLQNHRQPVGRCPTRPVVVKYARGGGGLWPPHILGVRCAHEAAHCAANGPHTCLTLYVSRTVLRSGVGFTNKNIPVDCICAAPPAALVPNRPMSPIVI